MAQGSYTKSGGYFIKGGSQRLTDRLVTAIRDGGSTVLTGAPAVRIDLDAKGDVDSVRYRDLERGVEIDVATRHVFANAAPQVVVDMLPQCMRATVMERFERRPLSISPASATSGLDRPPVEFGVTSYSTVLVPDWLKTFSDFKHGTTLSSSDPDGRTPVLCVVDFGQIDSGLRSEGLHPLNIVCPDRLENWAGLDDEAYRHRRDAWRSSLIARLDAEWPGLAAAVNGRTMATARTMHAHLNTPGGAVFGFAMRPPGSWPRHPPRPLETQVGGLWIASAYTRFGGFTGAIGSGIAAARAALRAGLGDLAPS